MKYRILTVAAAMATTGLAAEDVRFFFAYPGQVFAEDFNAYRGTPETLPVFFSVSWDEGRILPPDDPYTGVGDFATSDPDFEYGAFAAFTADGENHSFGIREREPVDLRDARLFFAFTNHTGVPIDGFNVSYDVEAWYRGDRLNRIRLKYDTYLERDARDTFEMDIFSTPNPSAAESLDPDTKQDGSLPENRTTVSGYVDLSAVVIDPSDAEGATFGPLLPGETAYFRWQFSNLEEGESGSLRSGLAVNNLRIVPVGGSAGLCAEAGESDNHPYLGGLYQLGGCWALLWDGVGEVDWGIAYVRDLDPDGAGWIYHETAGWLYVGFGDTATGLFLYSADADDWIVAADAYGELYYSRADDAFFPW
ncbi:MAG: hypothetical protein JJU00_12450 [Opitutales bacterium]|nr:hypothetical protein [Opitutales bacterium]